MLINNTSFAKYSFEFGTKKTIADAIVFFDELNERNIAAQLIILCF